MNATPAFAPASASDVPLLLRGDPGSLTGWLAESGGRRLVWCIVIMIAASAIYGASIGCWRSPLQAFYTAVKFPLILLMTGAGNALINSILAPLLGMNISFRQSLQAVVMSFTLLAVILGAFSPIVLFMIWNVPPLEASFERSTMAFNVIKISQVGLIAFAGVMANVRLIQLLRALCGSLRVARRVVLAWLGVNLLLGAQLTWILRPFFGSPHFEVEFFRDNALEGNFFEIVFHSAKYILTQ